MSIADLMGEILLPEREIIINKAFNIEGKQAIVLTITQQGSEVKTWLIHQIDLMGRTIEEWEREPEYATNRAEKTASVEGRQNMLRLVELTIQGNTLQFDSSSAELLRYQGMGLMKLQHFLESGVDLSPVANISLDELFLCEYKAQEGTPFPQIDSEQPLAINLKIDEECCEVKVSPPHKFQLGLGENTKETAYSFIDDETDKKIEFYIDRLIKNDHRAEVREQLQDEKTIAAWRKGGFDDAKIQEMKKEFIAAADDFCPEGYVMLLLQYETPADIQLNFYTTEHLDAAPEYKNECAIGIIINSNAEGSKHGCDVRTAILGNVTDEFSGDVEFELFSWVRLIPGTVIEL